MSGQVLELPVYFSLQIDTKVKTTSMALSYRYHYSPDDSLVDYTTNNLSHIFLYFFKMKNKQNTFKTKYYPLT